MSTTDRQNRLLVAEDWKRIYQSFRNADFQSYDFENLRRVMVSYIRENYPEDFNDYIESSEYLALIDLIAFLGQSLAFRIDLNARDNFLELAERRESVLRLAQLLSYNAKRNIAASGLLKFVTVSTTQIVYDSNGKNLSGQTIQWNDPSNPNWYDQFIKVINASLPASRQFGNPDDKGIIYGIPTEQYRFQASNTDVPIYSFTKAVDGRNLQFEVVSTTFKDQEYIYEEPPAVGNRMAFLYRNDGKGNGSSNTGFFVHFKQGILNQGTFTIDQPSTNELIDINAFNINNDDVWLYKLDSQNLESEYWAKISALEGNNTIYNSLKKNIRNIYTVVSRTNDAVSLGFSDGVFGTLPRGTFRVYYRQSSGIKYIINPKDIRNVTIEVPYVSNVNQFETISITVTLTNSVANAAETESNDSIKANAPATYYTQNRMITGEDYNISPLNVNQQVIKIKSVNRTSSGISRYFDLVDPTGKYSKTNLFADDGVLFKEEYTDSFRFNYNTKTDIEAVIYNNIVEILKSKQLRDFYYSKFTRIATESLNVKWFNRTSETNQSTGFIADNSPGAPLTPYKTGTYTSTLLRFMTPGALIQFEVPNPTTEYFNLNNNNTIETILPGQLKPYNSSTTRWCKVVSVYGDGTNNLTGILTDGTGPVVLNDIIPSNAVIKQIIPAFRATIDTNTVSTMVDLVFSNKPFGLRYDVESRTWKIVFEVNLDTANSFNLGKQGDISNQQLDSSWLILFTTDTEFYTVRSRLMRYIFESDKQLRFYFDASDKIYDTRSNVVVKDKIKILSINTEPDLTIPFTYDKEWEITEEFRGVDGYVDTKKIQLTFSDSDDDSVVDNPNLFEETVAPTINSTDKYVVQELYQLAQNQEDYRWVDNSLDIVKIRTSQSVVNVNSEVDGQYFYFIDTNTVKMLNKTTGTFEVTLDYKVYQGRDNIKFQYIHNADYESRIDPGLTNIIDIFVLTKDYDESFRQWLNGSIEEEPLPPSTDFLYNMLSTELNKIKSVSDEIIYHPVRYKVLFGSAASIDLQSSFKVVKNPEVVISDNDIKAKVLSAINEFFALENWDFGDNFYFTELSTYVMNRLAPNLANFLIVPKQSDLTFGSLFEIKSEKDQIFINGATVDDIEIISAVTASRIKSNGSIAYSITTNSQQGITSAGNN
jgi:hypothetical protein